MAEDCEDTHADSSERTGLIADKDDEEKCNDIPELSKRRQICTLIIILSLQFFISCTESIVYPFFPGEAAKRGLSKVQIGLVFSAYEFATFVTAPIAGSLVAKLTPRRLCLTGGALTAASTIAFGLLYYAGTKIFLPLCVVVRLVTGSAIAMVDVASISMLLKATSYQRGTIMFYWMTVRGGGFAAGPSLGAGLFEISGYACTFYVLGGLITVFTVIQAFFLPIVEDSNQSEKNFLQLLKIPGLVVVSVSHCLAQIGANSRLILIGNFMTTTFHVTVSTVGIWMAVWSGTYLALCPIMGILVNKGFIFSCMVFSWTLNPFISLLLGPSPLLDFIFHGEKSFWLTVITMAVSQLAQVVIYLTIYPVSLNLAEVNGYDRGSLLTYGMVAGMVKCSAALGSMVGPLISGALAECLNFPWTMTIMALMQIIMLAALVTYLVVMRITKQPLEPEKADNVKDDDEVLTE